jgi:hypothetical protein
MTDDTIENSNIQQSNNVSQTGNKEPHSQGSSKPALRRNKLGIVHKDANDIPIRKK